MWSRYENRAAKACSKFVVSSDFLNLHNFLNAHLLKYFFL
jgi:hypothetical protein